MRYGLCNPINLNVWEECRHIGKGQSIQIYCLVLTGSHPITTGGLSWMTGNQLRFPFLNFRYVKLNILFNKDKYRMAGVPPYRPLLG